ncbi:MAG: response regulator [Nitrosopumilaceae archaeon]|nr:response regulator transcription factor [Nitrosopumilaceae archaeon]NIU87515.1 response regulator [Nitrosopumilaceae archaeon]NIV65978.1 response regulator [Nitrosopumilaceae archaeon]NIX61674.1 response regulator [Nitrosopumilaceae archaeon]
MINVLIADDHLTTRNELKNILEANKNMIVKAVAKNGDEVLTKTRTEHFDVLLLDISMPGKNGFEVLKELRKTNSELAVLIVSQYPEEQFAIQAIKEGANGYLSKRKAFKELITAIETIYRGKQYPNASSLKELRF